MSGLVVPTLADSYAYCEKLAQTQAGNFYHGFRLLPGEQRLAMCALYAFMRLADDATDEAGTLPEKQARLQHWRDSLQAAWAGEYRHLVFPALHDSITKFQVPTKYLEAALVGVGMDLTQSRYRTFADLYGYCYHVASVVGLACIHIWGFTDPKACTYAETAGIAFQLTNILRDLGEDARLGRLYLPTEDLLEFGVTEADLLAGQLTLQTKALLRFEASRAYDYYRAATQLSPLLQPAGRAVYSVMLGTYRALLDKIVAQDFNVFQTRVRVSRWRKLWLVAQALPIRWGWR